MRAFQTASGSWAGRIQHAANRNSHCNCFNRGRPFNGHSLLNYVSKRPVHGSTFVRAWQQVTDQASGKPYYWNTDTNETAWELPQGVFVTTMQQQQQQGRQEDPAGPTMSYDMLYNILQEAYNTDGSGMQFWEVARAHRNLGVFDASFFEFLEQKQHELAGADEAGKEMAFKIMCRLSNPLLRQPAPFE